MCVCVCVVGGRGSTVTTQLHTLPAVTYSGRTATSIYKLDIPIQKIKKSFPQTL
jgi:hypothetical protein